MSGYISLHREIRKHWLYTEKREFSKYEAWLDILMRVNHAEGKVTHNGTLEIVSRGSTIWSMGDMESHWGWSNRKVKRFLDCLQADRMLTFKSTTKKTYITVINYDNYQSSDVDKTPPTHHESISNAYQKHTNNNELITINNKDKDRLLDDRPAVPIETNIIKPESFYNAHHRIYGFYCNNYQVEQLGAYIDNDGMEESVIIRALERAALAKSSHNFKFILGILNTYLKSKSLTLLEAIASDEEFERGAAEKQFKNSNASPNRRPPNAKPRIEIIKETKTPETPSPDEWEKMLLKVQFTSGEMSEEDYQSRLKDLEAEHATVT